ncbi:MAG: recombinase family protein [Burkholderiales bacterium]|nr:recombinase family protein [Burkholderiales bacterium]
MQRVAIYARYSSDLQRDASIEDQIRVCTKRVNQEGWQIVNTYTDHGISGASLMRPGIQMLMQDAMAGKFDVVLAEGLDRLSRDQQDIAGIYKRFQFSGIALHTLSDGGEVSDIHIGLKGTMNALFLKDLAAKTHRGLSGRIQKGKSGGGLCYGYRVIKQMDSNGEAIRGDREIIEEEAEIIRQIFRDYAAGVSPKKMAQNLNKQGIPCPSGKAWGASTIYGNRRRGTGVINNELYIGRLVWNRQRFIKDPDTGKRIARPNPEKDWIITEVPHLRIIDQDLWDSAKARQKALDDEPQFWAKQRPQNLFSYLLTCGCCGSGMSKVSADRYGCSASRNKGTCSNRLTIKQDNLEHTILEALQHYLMTPELVKVFCEEYTKHINELRRTRNAAIDRSKKELAKLEVEKEKLIQAIKDGVPGSEVKGPMLKIVERREQLEKFLEDKEEAPVLLHPNMALRYQEEVNALRVSLNQEETRTEAAELLRSLINKIVLTPKADGKEYAIDLHGDLAGILTVSAGKHKRIDESDPLLQQVKMMTESGDQKIGWQDGSCSDEFSSEEKMSDKNDTVSEINEKSRKSRLPGDPHNPMIMRQDKLVAGVGFEPTTFGL